MYASKKNVVATVVILLICLNISVQTVFAQNASLDVEPPTAIIDIDEELTVNITINDLPEPGLFSYQLVLQFDENYLEAISADAEPSGHFLTPTSGVPPGIFVVDPGSIDNELGTVSFAVTLLAPEEGKSGSGVLCTVTFRGKAQGLASLMLDEVILADPQAHAIPEEDYDVNDGEITVIPEFSAIAMMLLLLAATGVILLLKRKSLLGVRI